MGKPRPYVSPRDVNGKLEFAVFLSSPTDCNELRQSAEAVLTKLNLRYPFEKRLWLRASSFSHLSFGVGAPAQEDIEAQLPMALERHPIVLGFADQRLGPQTRKEMLTAVNAAEPRPFTLFFIAKHSRVDWRDSSGRQAREELQVFAQDLEKIHDGVVFDFSTREGFTTLVEEKLARYLESYLKELDPAPAVIPAHDPWPPEVSPYPGLPAMRFEDRKRFVGRDDELAACLRMLCEEGRRVLFVRGPSGIGKSSLLMAGLLPRLLERVAGTALIVSLGDGESVDRAIDPFLALARATLVRPDGQSGALSGGNDQVLRLARKLAHSNEGIRQVLDECSALPKSAQATVLCLDQAEYLTGRCESGAVREFTTLLQRSLDAGGLTVLCTWRDEDSRFFEAEDFAGLRGLSDGNVFSLGPLNRSGLVGAIREPARRAGYDVDSSLIDQLVVDVAAQPNSLPLLAAALHDIHQRWYAEWRQAPADARPSRIFSKDLYTDLREIVDRLDEKALALASDDERAELGTLFWGLVRFDGRRPYAVAMDRSTLGARSARARLTEQLVGARLLLATGGKIELAHSRLLDLWWRLATWIDDQRADLESFAYWHLRAERWVNRGRDTAHLLSWEEAASAEKLLRCLARYLSESDLRHQQVTALVRESLRIRGFLEGIRKVDFDMICAGLAAGAELSEQECGQSWAFYKAMRGDYGVHFSDAEREQVANRGFRPSHFAALANNVAMLREFPADVTWLDRSSQGGWTPLHMAAYTGALLAADWLVRAGCRPDSLTFDGYTPLGIACNRGHREVVDYLLYCGAALDGGGGTPQLPPLFAAVAASDRGMVELLLAKGANANSVAPDGTTLLQSAASSGDARIVLELLAHGAPIDARDPSGLTSLHRAIAAGHTEIVTQLLAHGADPFARVEPSAADDGSGASALHVASAHGRLDLCRLLLERVPRLLNGVDSDGLTPLHVSAAQGQAAVFEFLLDAGADVAARDAWGQTALTVAAREGLVDAVRAFHSRFATGLLATEAVTSVPSTTRSGVSGLTLLHCAARSGQAECCDVLLELAPALLEMRCVDGYTALHLAAAGGHIEVLTLLMRRGARLSDSAGNGLQALHLAAMAGHDEACRWIVNKSQGEVDCNARGLEQATALHLAILGVPNEHLRRTVGTLLELGADPDLAMQDGRTALHLAVERHDVDLVDDLLKAGASTALRDAQQRTPLLAALATGNDVCGSLLRWADPAAADEARHLPWVALSQDACELAAAAVEEMSAAGAEPPRWLSVPVLRSAWQDLPRAELIELLATLDAYQAEDGKPRTLQALVPTGVRALALPFYPGFSLVELALIERSGNPPCACVMALLWGRRAEFRLPVASPRCLLVLDGGAASLHLVSCRLPITLDNEADATLFLRLFSGYLRGAEDNFVIIDSFAELNLPDEAGRRAWRSVETQITPLICTDHSENSYYFSATVLYRSILYRTRLRVDRCGFVRMESDDRLTSQPMPIGEIRWSPDGCRLLRTGSL